ncbi:hypothetical protein BaRGS_00016289 [Batillaria attramentaria]|uniref:Uncharacterized protein n=1 Tax=Batillaria attramentaria TaxID=370345 RepID=A0ABD0KYV1_9CAEN
MAWCSLAYYGVVGFGLLWRGVVWFIKVLWGLDYYGVVGFGLVCNQNQPTFAILNLDRRTSERQARLRSLPATFYKVATVQSESVAWECRDERALCHKKTVGGLRLERVQRDA